MANDFFYNFSNKIDEDESLKLNLDELYTKKQEQDLNVMNNYNVTAFSGSKTFLVTKVNAWWGINF